MSGVERPADGKRVLAAMSGGVDSSVAAALLVEAGFSVVGITMKLPGDETGGEGVCCSLEAAEGARQVAARLGIPHYAVDLRDDFERLVVGPFIADYMRGRTPNPCVLCNRVIKLGVLWDRARALECDFVATGHYARVLCATGHGGAAGTAARTGARATPPEGRGPGEESRRGRYLLWRARDRRKDQSYVLYRLGQQELGRLLLPLGHLTKARVREMARRRGFPTAGRPESQEICFIPGGDYREFLRERLGDRVFAAGPIVSREGEVLGEHPGLAFFTVGQRRGLGIRRPGPWYVVEIRPEENALVVGRQTDLLGCALEAEEARFIPFDWPPGPLQVEAQVRYRGPALPAVVTSLGEGRVRVDFREPQRAIAPGQAVVFYQGDLVVGGATIACTLGD
ncbi:MAG: tRNA 2-thiouridine(34) synthase MnmA [Bacillota bacterium]|nr:tRNA 2-thiouridine(34) synthase MnmA [Bacillota bacterium]